MSFIDTHCHLDDDAFDRDLPDVLTSAREAGVGRFINIGYEPESWNRSIALADRYPFIAFTLGMHPNSADRWSSEAALRLTELIESNRPCGIGEIGLDCYRDRTDLDVQRVAFRDQLEIAERYALPVVIHMRGDVEPEIIASLGEHPGIRVVFHSFDASPDLRDYAIERGHFIGVGGLMTRAGSATLRETLAAVPLDNLLLETDSPYLSPRGVKDRRNTPASIPLIAAALADLLDVPIEAVAAKTTDNARSIFGLDRASESRVTD